MPVPLCHIEILGQFDLLLDWVWVKTASLFVPLAQLLYIMIEQKHQRPNLPTRRKMKSLCPVESLANLLMWRPTVFTFTKIGVPPWIFLVEMMVFFYFFLCGTGWVGFQDLTYNRIIYKCCARQFVSTCFRFNFYVSPSCFVIFTFRCLNHISAF